MVSHLDRLNHQLVSNEVNKAFEPLAEKNPEFSFIGIVHNMKTGVVSICSNSDQEYIKKVLQYLIKATEFTPAPPPEEIN